MWREKEVEVREQRDGALPGQVRVLVVGDSGVGKTSLVHLIVKGSSISCPPRTIGCTVGVKHVTYGNPGSSSNNIKGDTQRDFFIELWDVSGHECYREYRSLFYTQINGVIFVHDLSQRRTMTNMRKWAAEIAATATFSAPLGSGGPGGLLVPYLVIANKADITAKNSRSSSGNLVDVAHQWVKKQGLLSNEQLPLTESFPGTPGLLAAAKEARYDKEAIIKFFRMLIRRRYFHDDLPASSPWTSSAQNLIHDSKEITYEDDPFHRTLSFSGHKYKHSRVPPFSAQQNLTSLPAMYPRQPPLVTENHGLLRFSTTGLPEIVGDKLSMTGIDF